jgi:hypothetical protein
VRLRQLPGENGGVKFFERYISSSQFEPFTNFRAFEALSQSSQNAVHKLACTCRRYHFPSSSGYRDMFMSDINIKNVQSETLASAVRISRNSSFDRYPFSHLFCAHFSRSAFRTLSYLRQFVINIYCLSISFRLLVDFLFLSCDLCAFPPLSPPGKTSQYNLGSTPLKGLSHRRDVGPVTLSRA